MSGLSCLSQPTRRNAFFSFHYADLMRVNVVRLSGTFKTERNPSGRSIEGFYDHSLWESAKSYGPDNIKRLIREGLERTSVVCVLIGSETHSRRWVRYEVARSVVDGKGLAAIHVNSIRGIAPPHATKPLGINPAEQMGVSRRPDGKFYLCEYDPPSAAWRWYGDYVRPVEPPRYLGSTVPDGVVPLARGTRLYDWIAQNGHANVGGWLDRAAADAGR